MATDQQREALAPNQAVFVVQALVAAGHVSQELVDAAGDLYLWFAADKAGSPRFAREAAERIKGE